MHRRSPTGRFRYAATLLNDGSVLMTGGTAPQGGNCSVPIAGAELYHPAVTKPAPRLLSLSGDGRGAGAIQHADTYQLVSDQNPAHAWRDGDPLLHRLIDNGAIPPPVWIGGRMANVLWFGKTPGEWRPKRPSRFG